TERSVVVTLRPAPLFGRKEDPPRLEVATFGNALELLSVSDLSNAQLPRRSCQPGDQSIVFARRGVWTRGRGRLCSGTGCYLSRRDSDISCAIALVGLIGAEQLLGHVVKARPRSQVEQRIRLPFRHAQGIQRIEQPIYRLAGSGFGDHSLPYAEFRDEPGIRHRPECLGQRFVAKDGISNRWRSCWWCSDRGFLEFLGFSRSFWGLQPGFEFVFIDLVDQGDLSDAVGRVDIEFEVLSELDRVIVRVH